MSNERRCRECGCTDMQACPGGCWWVEPDLCSTCHHSLHEDPQQANPVNQTDQE